ncbi:hypothetical protein [Bacteroides fragilis]|uniref:hypothetical protein n=1 Tax=Bacteroides fragilis TaxID=817 RepID=UPI0037043EBE|nr:hypothetical protein [Bacteroides fragilis]MCE8651170.1 hypothetical protein [Bacteroides fragilis]
MASCTRSGANNTVDRINKHFPPGETPIVSSSSWNMLFDSHSPMEPDGRGMRPCRRRG